MSTTARIRSSWRNLLRRRHIERDLDAEVLSYAELLAEENMRQGLNPKDAKRKARLDLGGTEQVKEEVRANRAGAWLEAVVQDLRYAARILRKNPGFTAVAVFTLALGIGANTAVFSIVDSVVLRPLPYKDSSRLVEVTTRTAMFPAFDLGISWPAFERIRDQATAFEESALFESGRMKLTQQGAPVQLDVVNVSDRFFEELGEQPQIGRLLLPQDQKPGQNQVAVVSDAFWRKGFGGAADVLGKSLVLNQKSYLIVGVAPRGFSFPEKADAWIPFALSAEDQQNLTAFMCRFLGKLRRGESLAHAQAQLHTIAERIRNDAPELRDGFELRGESLMEEQVGDVRKAYLLLLGAATFVLLIACSNLASLLLARGWGRQREMALRAALGASHGRIARQVLVESVLLALLGGAVGIVLAIGGLNLFRAIAPAGTARLTEIAPNPSLLWFALIISVVAGLIFGFAPARRASSMDPNYALKEGSSDGVAGTGSARQPRLGSALVIVEVALAFVLLIGAALTIQSFSRLVRVNTGMRTDHLLTFDLPTSTLQPGMTTAQMESAAAVGTERLREILDQIQHIPGVQGAAATDYQVLGGTSMMMRGLKIEGAVPSNSAAERIAYSRYATPSFFPLLGIPVVRGRAFTDHDVRGGQRVTIVNETMARQYWGTLDVVGKHLSMSTDDKGQPEWSEVVGVVADTRDVRLSNKPHSEYYVPIYLSWNDSHQIMVRTAGDPNALAGVISKQIWKTDPEQLITNLQTMDRTIAETVGEPKLRAILLGVFAGVGLALALLGVYGVLAYSVARRTREIGIRMALGARPPDVLRMVMRQGLLLALAGIVLGACAALALSRLIESELFGVEPTDPLTFAAAAALMIVVACLACYVPAWRAMRTDPMVALRHE
jgi:predicted permease